MRGSPSSRVSVGKVQQGLFFFFFNQSKPFSIVIFLLLPGFPTE